MMMIYIHKPESVPEIVMYYLVLMKVSFLNASDIVYYKLNNTSSII